MFEAGLKVGELLKELAGLLSILQIYMIQMDICKLFCIGPQDKTRRARYLVLVGYLLGRPCYPQCMTVSLEVLFEQHFSSLTDFLAGPLSYAWVPLDLSDSVGRKIV
jgi:hypothetical protein